MEALETVAKAKPKHRVLAHFTVAVDTNSYLELPAAVGEHLLSDRLILEGRNGVKYDAKVVRTLDRVYVRDGWVEFEQDQDMEEGDILVCKLYDDSRLWVAIADKNGMNLASNMSSTLQTEEKKMEINAPNSCTDKQTIHRAKPTHLSANIYSRLRSAKRVQIPAKIFRQIQAVKAKISKRDHIIVELNKYRTEYNCPLPGSMRGFAEDGEYIQLAVAGFENHKVKWFASPKKAYLNGFGSGWASFVNMHDLKAGDWLLLELADEKILKVRMFFRHPKPQASSRLTERRNTIQVLTEEPALKDADRVILSSDSKTTVKDSSVEDKTPIIRARITRNRSSRERTSRPKHLTAFQKEMRQKIASYLGIKKPKYGWLNSVLRA